MPNKICPKCKASKHVRVSKCDCGHSFYALKSEKQERTPVVISEEPIVKPTISVSKGTGSFLNLVKQEEKGEQPSSSGIDHNTPGRGKKQCLSCKKYVGAKLKICNLCNFDFEQKTVVEKEIVESPISEVKVFDGPGKGKKQCSSCKKYVGVRSLKCICGFSFEISSNSKEKPVIIKTKTGIITPPAPTKSTFLTLLREAEIEKNKPVPVKKEKEFTTFKIEGRGRKKCPKCDTFIPVATRVCQVPQHNGSICGHVFEKREDNEYIEAGQFIKYDKNNPLNKSIDIYIIDGYDSNLNINRDFKININSNEELSCAEIDDELVHATNKKKIEDEEIQQTNLNKSPEDIINFLISRFNISEENISWFWLLKDDLEKEESQYPLELRKTYSGKIWRRNHSKYVTNYVRNPNYEHPSKELEWQRYKFIKSKEIFNPPNQIFIKDETKYPWWLETEIFKKEWPPSKDAWREFQRARKIWIESKKHQSYQEGWRFKNMSAAIQAIQFNEDLI